MPHRNKVIDKDAHFEIDPITRAIKNASSAKVSIIQYDHNSERFSFTIPRYIEEHDMMECNKVEVHYINVSSDHKKQNVGVYTVTDLAQHTTDSDKVTCTWLLSQNVTLYAGAIQFLLRFSCIAGDGVTVDYVWNSGIYTGISVTKGINNGEAIIVQYADILEAWKKDIIANLQLDDYLSNNSGAIIYKGNVLTFGDVPTDNKDNLYSVGGKAVKVTGRLYDLFVYEELFNGYIMTDKMINMCREVLFPETDFGSGAYTASLYNPTGEYVGTACRGVPGATDASVIKKLYRTNNPESEKDVEVCFYVALGFGKTLHESGVAFWNGEKLVKLPSELRMEAIEAVLARMQDEDAGIQGKDMEGVLKFKGNLTSEDDLPDDAVTGDMYGITTEETTEGFLVTGKANVLFNKVIDDSFYCYDCNLDEYVPAECISEKAYNGSTMTYVSIYTTAGIKVGDCTIESYSMPPTFDLDALGVTSWDDEVSFLCGYKDEKGAFPESLASKTVVVKHMFYNADTGEWHTL